MLPSTVAAQRASSSVTRAFPEAAGAADGSRPANMDRLLSRCTGHEVCGPGTVVRKKMSTRHTKHSAPKPHLDRVVDEPLQRRQGSDHDDPREQALPHSCNIKVSTLNGRHNTAESSVRSLALNRVAIAIFQVALSHSPQKPRLRATPMKVAVSSLFSFDTIVSAGCDTTAQKTPAMYPAMKVTTSCSGWQKENGLCQHVFKQNP